MVESVGLEQPAIGPPQPFVAVEPIVSADGPDPALSAETSAPSGRERAQRLGRARRDIPPRHCVQLGNRGAIGSGCGKQTRTGSEIKGQSLALAVRSRASGCIATPTLDKEAMREPDRLREKPRAKSVWAIRSLARRCRPDPRISRGSARCHAQAGSCGARRSQLPAATRLRSRTRGAATPPLKDRRVRGRPGQSAHSPIGKRAAVADRRNRELPLRDVPTLPMCTARLLARRSAVARQECDALERDTALLSQSATAPKELPESPGPSSTRM